jgi:hypothetical protein
MLHIIAGVLALAFHAIRPKHVWDLAIVFVLAGCDPAHAFLMGIDLGEAIG